MSSYVILFVSSIFFSFFLRSMWSNAIIRISFVSLPITRQHLVSPSAYLCFTLNSQLSAHSRALFSALNEAMIYWLNDRLKFIQLIHSRFTVLGIFFKKKKKNLFFSPFVTVTLNGNENWFLVLLLFFFARYELITLTNFIVAQIFSLSAHRSCWRTQANEKFQLKLRTNKNINSR